MQLALEVKKLNASLEIGRNVALVAQMGNIAYRPGEKVSWNDARQSFATETAKAIIKFGFTKCKLHRIEAGVATLNIASIKVLEKAGMKCEGIRSKILPIRGEWKDNFHYAIVEDEFN